MTKRVLAPLVLLIVLIAPSAAQSQQAPPPAPPAPAAPPPEPEYPIVRIGALSYLQYDAELEHRDRFNAFDVTRAYLNVNAQISRNVRFRFTPDIRRINDGTLSGSLILRVKYAYGQFDNLTPRSWVRFGAHQTPWLDFEESIDRYRVQGTMFAEREGLIPGSSDLGVSYFTPLPGNYGEIHGGVYNGEGYALPEVNRFKSAQLRVTVRPLPNTEIIKGFRLSAFYSEGWYAAGRPRQLGIVMGSFEQTHVVATAQALRGTERPEPFRVNADRPGWSVFVEPRQGVAGLAGILRYDHFDPDDAIGGNAQDRVIAGGAYWFIWPRAKLAFVVTNEQVHYDLPSRLDENRLLVQTLIEF